MPRRRDGARAQEEQGLLRGASAQDGEPSGAHPLQDLGFASEESRPRGTGRKVAGCLVPLLILGGLGVGGWQAYEHLGNYFGSESCRFAVDGDDEKRDPEQAANAATIVDAGVLRRGLPDRAALIAVTTAVQESKLRNLSSGDRDSLGLFQQRPSQGWGTESQITDPVYASNSFYQHLVQIDGWRSLEVNEVAQRVQRSGHPQAYADHEQEGTVIAGALDGDEPEAVGCRIDEPDGAGNATRTAQTLTEQTGVEPSVSDGSVTARTRTTRGAWAVAGWAVTHAKYEQVTEVTVGDRAWVRQRGKDGWTWQQASNPTGSDTRVRIDVHTG